VLDLVPSALNSRSKIPISRGPATGLAQRLKVFNEGGSIWRGTPPTAINNCIHDETHAHDSATMHQPRSAWGEARCLREDVRDSGPKLLEQEEHSILRVDSFDFSAERI